MALQLRRGGGEKPPVAVIFGKPGIGKTTLAACAPKPMFIQSEDGLTSPQLAWVPNFGVLDTYERVLESFAYVATNHATEGWKTVVIDSVDRLMPLIVDFVCRQNGWKKLEDGAYGRGKVTFIDEVRNFMTCCMALRNDVGLGVIILGHCKAGRVSPPDADPYTQYTLAIQEDAARILISDSDMVLFATHPITTISQDRGFGQKSTRAITQSPRLYTQERGAHIAKNRYNMPEWIPMEWAQIAAYVPTWAAELPQSAATAADTAATAA